MQKATGEAEEVYQPQHAFADFTLHWQLAQNIVSRGYINPTPIQDQAIPYLLAGRDLVGTASTGTGKTAAFLIPLINKVAQDPFQRVLIVVPTRELAVQIRDEFNQFARGLNQFSALCIGGVSMRPQIQSLSRRPHFVIGTPGRLQDLERQRKLSFASYNNIVLDEVDRMLDMGFVHEVTEIVPKLSYPRQSLFFSATMTSNVQRVMQGFLNNPITVAVRATQPSANVDQDIVRLAGQAKVDVLHNLLQQEGFDKVLVFGRTKWGMEKLSQALAQKGHRVASIHGNKGQSQRQRAITDFKQNRVKVLLATDIASRGLDIENVTHVINFDQPESYEDYIHRIGRTGRANRKGIALTFVE
ncbi:DEAD/DEAH box helicase [Candidatus Microgenomates bacterium]|nr:DEAD/DEAH box helicase [Candidatus Microgenomates bacterium]